MIRFWEIIGASPVRTGNDVQHAVHAITARLQQVSALDIIQFDDRLHEYLYRLDLNELAEIPVVLPGIGPVEQTEDGFLYARCACILSGEAEYSRVVRTRTGFDRFVVPSVGAELLLYAAHECYEAKTGRAMKSISWYPMDWMSNPDGWPPETTGDSH